jgi:hypothetical protein
MFNAYRPMQHRVYQQARQHLIDNPSILLELEKYCADLVFDVLRADIDEIRRDYDEAAKLFPFWQNYPPDERGRQPRGDQFPWIEVGEHAIGAKLGRLLVKRGFELRDTGLPTGPDQRFVLLHSDFERVSKGFSPAVWLFVDIKSVGPRDDADHTVMSHNQVSGDGNWDTMSAGVKNSVLTATGARTSHHFHCSLPPVYVLSDGLVVPVILIALKPVYRMLSLDSGLPAADGGQPLSRITVVSIPNGILLTTNPNYLKTYPSLLFPGKDDKGKNPLKLRARVSFNILRKIAEWRVRDIT